MYVCMNVCINMYVRIYVLRVCMYLCMYVCMYVCMCVYPLPESGIKDPYVMYMPWRITLPIPCIPRALSSPDIHRAFTEYALKPKAYSEWKPVHRGGIWEVLPLCVLVVWSSPVICHTFAMQQSTLSKLNLVNWGILEHSIGTTIGSWCELRLEYFTGLLCAEPCGLNVN